MKHIPIDDDERASARESWLVLVWQSADQSQRYRRASNWFLCQYYVEVCLVMFCSLRKRDL